MKKGVKILIFILSALFIAFICFLTYCFILSLGTKLDKDKLINLDAGIVFCDTFGNVIDEQSSGTSITELKNVPEHLKNAFIAVEDKRFYSHNGVDFKGILRATKNNLFSFSFKEGASTISQQLIKNTHLSGEKTLKRKILEIKLSRELEKNYSKDEILEKYLNTIYFGENCYGITSASKKFFGKNPCDLTLNECAILAGVIKAPSTYSVLKNPEKCYERKNVVLKQMLSEGYITQTEYEKNASLTVAPLENDEKGGYDYLYLAKKEADELLQKNPVLSYKKINVFTHYNPEIQNYVLESIKNDVDCDKTVMVTDKFNNVIAYYSSVGEISRSVGSTIKPLLVYAPAIEDDVVYSCTKIVDEKTDFNGYSPKNFNDKYYGSVSVKTALAKSLNTCAVKLLSYTGIEKSLSYLQKTYIKTTENDKNLAIALGATEKGASMSELLGSYNLFLNNGELFSMNLIDKIEVNGKKIYQNKKNSDKVFSSATTFLVNDMMREATLNGTGKKLSFTNAKIYSKTGTVGNENGNTDAYSISFTPDYALGVWYGNKDNSLLPNSVTGGSSPTVTASEIWNEIYKNKECKVFEMDDSLCMQKIDKSEYEKGNVILADDNAPEKYKLEEYFKKTHVPIEKSTAFSTPIVEKPKLLVDNNRICFRLCLVEYQNIRIYKHENGKKTLIYDTKNGSKKEFYDYGVIGGETYYYSYIPYSTVGENEYLGKEVFLDKIKTPTSSVGENWWIEDN